MNGFIEIEWLLMFVIEMNGYFCLNEWFYLIMCSDQLCDLCLKP